jgi:hypothetical protein
MPAIVLLKIFKNRTDSGSADCARQYFGKLMAESEDADGLWLAVIARSLAYFCLQDAQAKKPAEFSKIPAKVQFLQQLGLPEADAAYVAGSNPKSVQVMRSQKKGGRRGTKNRR